MTDIVERLRESVTQARALDRAALLTEAADEIERLTLTDAEREVLTAAPDWLHCGISQSEASALIETLRGLLERMK